MTILGMSEKDNSHKYAAFIALAAIGGATAVGIANTSAATTFKDVINSVGTQTLAICISIFIAVFIANKQMQHAKEINEGASFKLLEERKKSFEIHVKDKKTELQNFITAFNTFAVASNSNFHNWVQKQSGNFTMCYWHSHPEFLFGFSEDTLIRERSFSAVLSLLDNEIKQNPINPTLVVWFANSAIQEAQLMIDSIQ